MPVKLNSSGGGSVTVDIGSTASNFTQNLPLATTTLVGTDSTQTLSNKTFSGATTFGSASLAAPDGSAPLYMARAWVNFNGTGTVAIRASGNVSSITDAGVGTYTVNLINALPDANYSVCATGYSQSTFFDTGRTVSTTQVPIITGYAVNTSGGTQPIDTTHICVSIFR